jgi:hypothetical protein
MHEERNVIRGPEPGRWFAVAALLLIGLALYFVYAPHTDPPARPAEHEGR